MLVFLDFALLATICLFAYLTKRFLAAVAALFAFLFMKMLVSDGPSTENDYFQCVCILCMTIMIVKDCKLKQDQSLFMRYNPFVTNSRLPSWLRLTLLALCLFACLLRVFATIAGKP